MRDGFKDVKLTPKGTPAQPRPLKNQVAQYLTTETDALVGHVIRERYLIERPIGEGSMGKVYAAKDIVADGEVAIKVISTNALEHSTKDVVINRFIREAETAASVKHPNIIDVRGIGRFDDQIYYAMELIEGTTLETVIKTGQTCFDIPSFMHITKQICAGVQAAHNEKVVHRDLKPANIMISERNGKEHVTVVDFGLAKFKENETVLTISGSVLGTPMYMSPEQCLGKDCDNRSDIYSLGMIMYEMLTGTTPFHGDLKQIFAGHLTQIPQSPSTWRAGIPKQIEDAVMKALEKNPEDRFQSVNEFMKALDGKPIEKRNNGPAPSSGASRTRATIPTGQEFHDDIDDGKRGIIGKVVAAAVIGTALTLGYVYFDRIRGTADALLTEARGQITQKEEQPPPPPVVETKDEYVVSVKTIYKENDKEKEAKGAPVYERIRGSKGDTPLGKTPLEWRFPKGEEHVLVIKHGGRQYKVTVSETQNDKVIILGGTKGKTKKQEDVVESIDEGAENNEGPAEPGDQPADTE